jgi:hypothetical protein
MRDTASWDARDRVGLGSPGVAMRGGGVAAPAVRAAVAMVDILEEPAGLADELLLRVVLLLVVSALWLYGFGLFG